LRLISTFLCVLTATFCTGQSFHSRTYTEADGLASSTVTSLAQAPNGLLWFATRAGLTVYDGRDWVVHGPERGLDIRQIRRVEVDRDGRVYVVGGNAANRVLYYEDGTWLNLPHLDVDGRRSRVSLALCYRDGKTVPAVGYTGYGVFLFEEGRWHGYAREEGLQDEDVRGLAARGSDLYVGCSGGISVLTPDGVDNALVRALPPDRRHIWQIAIEPESLSLTGPPKLWVSGPGWLGVLSGNSFREVAKVPEVVRRLSIYGAVLAPDGNGGAFCGHVAAVYHYDRESGQIQHFGIDQGLADDGATEIIRDREGNLWFGGVRGVTVLPSMRFANYGSDQGLLEDEVTAVLEWGGGLLLGHDAGLTHMTAVGMRHIPLLPKGAPRDPGLRVMDLHPGRDGSVWMALSRQGLARLEPDYTVTNLATLPENASIYSLAESKDGTLWAGGDLGLYTYRDGVLEPAKLNGLDQRPVRWVHLGSDGTLYLAMVRGGLRVRDMVGWHEYRGPTALADEAYAVFEDSRYRVWLGTLDGLYQLVEDALVPYASGELTIERPVYFVTEDLVGRIWVGTDQGVYRLDGRSHRHYTFREGLAGNECNRDGVAVDSDGHIWIGTDRGVSLYRQSFDRYEPRPPVVSIAGVERDHARFTAARSQRFGGAPLDLTFHFSAISFVDEERVMTRYRLAGYDTEWQLSRGAGSHAVRYTSLPPGSFIFEVAAASNPEGWSDSVASEAIVITASFWLSRRALPIYALLLAVAALIVWYLRRAHGIRQRERLEGESEAELDQLDGIVRAINADLELDRLLATVSSKSLALCGPADAGCVLLYDHPSKTFGFSAFAGREPDLPTGYKVDARLLLERLTDGAMLAPGIYDFSNRALFPRKIQPIPPAAFRLVITLELSGIIDGLMILDGDGESGERALSDRELRTWGRLRDHTISALGKARFLSMLREKNREILETQRRAVMREKMASLGALTSGVAHEIRNPLNFINNFAAINLQILEEIRTRLRGMNVHGGDAGVIEPVLEELDELADGARLIDEHGRRAARIIERMIEFSVLADHAGAREPIDLFALLEDQATSVMMERGKRNALSQLRIHKQNDPELAPFSGNIDELSFLFGQLFANAHDALVECAVEREGFLPILAYKAQRLDGHVEIRIGDNGAGISEAHRTKLFTPFFTTRRDDVERLGLGLFMSYEIVVNGYNGDIQIERNEGMTEAIVTLPILAGSSRPELETVLHVERA